MLGTQGVGVPRATSKACTFILLPLPVACGPLPHLLCSPVGSIAQSTPALVRSSLQTNCFLSPSPKCFNVGPSWKRGTLWNTVQQTFSLLSSHCGRASPSPNAELDPMASFDQCGVGRHDLSRGPKHACISGSMSCVPVTQQKQKMLGGGPLAPWGWLQNDHLGVRSEPNLQPEWSNPSVSRPDQPNHSPAEL